MPDQTRCLGFEGLFFGQSFHRFLGMPIGLVSQGWFESWPEPIPCLGQVDRRVVLVWRSTLFERQGGLRNVGIAVWTRRLIMQAAGPVEGQRPIDYCLAVTKGPTGFVGDLWSQVLNWGLEVLVR